MWPSPQSRYGCFYYPWKFPHFPSTQFPSILTKNIFWSREKRSSGPGWDFCLLIFTKHFVRLPDPEEESIGSGWHRLEIACCGGRFDLTDWEHCCPSLTASPGGCSPVLKSWLCPARFLSRPVVPESLARSKHKFLVSHAKGSCHGAFN